MQVTVKEDGDKVTMKMEGDLVGVCKAVMSMEEGGMNLEVFGDKKCLGFLKEYMKNNPVNFNR